MELVLMNNVPECMGSKDCKKIAVVQRDYHGLEPLLPKLRGIFLCDEHKDKWPWDYSEDILKETRLEIDKNDS